MENSHYVVISVDFDGISKWEVSMDDDSTGNYSADL